MSSIGRAIVPLNYPLRFSILYETHVRGLTAHPNSKVKHPGTYSGVIEKIPLPEGPRRDERRIFARSGIQRKRAAQSESPHRGNA